MPFRAMMHGTLAAPLQGKGDYRPPGREGVYLAVGTIVREEAQSVIGERGRRALGDGTTAEAVSDGHVTLTQPRDGTGVPVHAQVRQAQSTAPLPALGPCHGAAAVDLHIRARPCGHFPALHPAAV